jgi:hypothetical protein
MKRVVACAFLLLSAGCSSSPTTTPTPTSQNASDDFERSQLGPNWKQVLGGSNAGIVANKDFGALSAGFMSVDWTSTFGADQFSEAVIAAGKNPNLMVQVHVRRQSGSLARYGFHFNLEKSPAVWEIKYDGVPTADTRILVSLAGSNPVAGDVIRIEARGREISGWLNGVRILVATDNAANAVLLTGGTGMTSRMATGTTTSYPAPIAASWKGGTLQ